MAISEFKPTIRAPRAISDPIVVSAAESAANRPGDARSLFSGSLTGAAKDIAPLTIGTVVTNEDGAVLRIPSEGSPQIIAHRQDFAIEPGQVYVGRAAARRARNTTDPLGDAVEFRLAFLDRNKALISHATVQSRSLLVSEGRIAFSCTFSRDQPADIIAPANCRYVRPYWRIFGGDGLTDIEVLDRWVTSGLPGPKGDTGDVTPAAAAARAEAVTAANLTSADRSATLAARQQAESIVSSIGTKIQRTSPASLVVDAAEYNFDVTNFSAGDGALIDARALEMTRPYTFRCYPNVSNSMRIDFGEGAIIAGYLGFRGFELTAGQAITVIKATDNVIYVLAQNDPVYRTMVGSAAFHEPIGNGEYRYWRRVTINAGATVNLGFPGQFAGNSPAGAPRLIGLSAIRTGNAADKSPVCTGLSDTGISIFNPNSEAIDACFEVEGLRIRPTSLAAASSHFRHLIPPLETARQLSRSYCVVLAGQSLADAYTNRSSYKGLDDALRAGGRLASGNFIDLINTAVGGSVADRRSWPTPATNTSFWYDSVEGTNGPLLTAALNRINAAVAAGKAPRALIFDLGQTDSLYLGTGANSQANYRIAMTAILAALKAAVGSAPIYLQTIIGRTNEGGLGTQLVREVQLELIASNPNVAGAVDGYDAPLIDTVHPTNDGYREIGRRVGQAISGAYDPPRIVSAVRSGAGIILTLSKAIDLVITPVGTQLTYFGGKTSSGNARIAATVASSTSIALSVAEGSSLPNLSSVTDVTLPRDDNAIGALSYAVDTSRNLIRSAVVAVTDG